MLIILNLTFQAYCHIITGAALAMAIRFAGSGNAQAFEVRL